MQRHGYKGAFELAATVDYLFGFDATAGVVARLDVRDARQGVRPRRDQPGVPAAVEPVGAARHRRAAARGRRPRAVGRARPGDRSPRCSRSTSTSRATWRTRVRRHPASSASGMGPRPGHRSRPVARCASVDYVLAPEQGRRRPAARASGGRSATAHGVRAGRRARPASATGTTRPTTSGAVADWHDGPGGGVRARCCASARRRRRRSWSGATRRSTTRTIRIVDRIARAASRSTYDVCPGSARPQLLAARHRIVLHEVGRAGARHHGAAAARGGRRPAQTTSW